MLPWQPRRGWTGCQQVTWNRVAGIPTPLPDGGLRQRVAFRTHPVQEQSVEQPWGDIPVEIAGGAWYAGVQPTIDTRKLSATTTLPT